MSKKAKQDQGNVAKIKLGDKGERSTYTPADKPISVEVNPADWEAFTKWQQKEADRKAKHKAYQRKRYEAQKAKREEAAKQQLIDIYKLRCRDHAANTPFLHKKRIVVPELAGLPGLRVWYRDAEVVFIPLPDEAA